MAYTQVEIQAQARVIGSSAGQYNEDLHAALTALGVTQNRQINERLLEYTGQLTASAAWYYLLQNGFTGITNFLITEDGDYLITESGDFIVWE